MTLELTFTLPEAQQDVFIALFSEAEGFWQEGDVLKAYVAPSDWTSERQEELRALAVSFGGREEVAVNEIAPQNWNASWEATIQPIAVPPFVVHPTWAPPPEEDAHLIPLVIDPKMSFGTGYHESTRLMLRMMTTLVKPNATVLDAGTGTGILAIAALKLGAASALTFDVDPWAEENAAENFAHNGVSDVAEVRIGEIGVVPEVGFDLVIANIHREVLLDLLPALVSKMNPDGHLMLAGLLLTDAPRMREAIREAGLKTVQEAEEGQWWAWAGARA